MTPPRPVPGYVFERALASDPTGSAWLGRDRRTGEPVTLRRVAVADRSAADRLRRLTAEIAALSHPHLAGVRGVVGDDDVVVLVTDRAAGGDLASVLAGRGRLAPPEVVTVIAPLARALGDLHARGIVHGALTPRAIVFTGDGRPLLADIGVAVATGEVPDPERSGFVAPEVTRGSTPDPRADVFGLAAVAFALLTGRPLSVDRPVLGAFAPPALVAAIEAGLDPDPARRPEAGELADAVLRAGPAAPVRLLHTPPGSEASSAPPTAPAPAPPPARGRHARRAAAVAGGGFALRAAAVLGGVALLGAAVLAGRAIGPGGTGPATLPRLRAQPPPAPGAPAPSTAVAVAPVSWRDVVERLEKLRAAAFDTADAAVLRSVYLPASAALRADAAHLAELSARGLHARGLAPSVEAVTVRARSATEVLLVVVDALGGYELVDSAGRVVATVAPRSSRRVVLRLRPLAGGWRIAEVASASRS
jgi:eukaryotic-like serine/threonine-protein kinase